MTRTVFADTSALLAIIDEGDARYAEVIETLVGLRASDAELITTNYVVVETVSLVQRRLGVGAVRLLLEDILPGVALAWVTPEWHTASLSALVVADRRHLSLVDCTSFEAMRRLNVHEVLALDRHFAEMGFEVLPQPR